MVSILWIGIHKVDVYLQTEVGVKAKGTKKVEAEKCPLGLATRRLLMRAALWKCGGEPQTAPDCRVDRAATSSLPHVSDSQAILAGSSRNPQSQSWLLAFSHVPHFESADPVDSAFETTTWIQASHHLTWITVASEVSSLWPPHPHPLPQSVLNIAARVSYRPRQTSGHISAQPSGGLQSHCNSVSPPVPSPFSISLVYSPPTSSLLNLLFLFTKSLSPENEINFSISSFRSLDSYPSLTALNVGAPPHMQISWPYPAPFFPIVYILTY